MSEQPEVTIYNVYDFVNYSFNQENGVLVVMWDVFNKDVENVMVFEKIPYDSTRKYSALWVDELKRRVGWNQGMEIQLATRYSYRNNTNGLFIITILSP